MATYNLIAANCPAPQVYSGILNPANGTPTTAPVLTAGISAGAQSMVGKFNEVSARGDVLGRLGGGIYAIANGLIPSAGSGTTINITAGQAIIDGPVTKTAGTLVGSNNNQNYLWLSRGGTFNKKLASDASPLTPPDALTPWVYLGLIPITGNVGGEVDLSGVLTLIGNLGFRTTADTGQPTDTPPASIRFYTITQGGLYLWDGTQYWTTSQSTAALTADLTDLSGAQAESDRLFRKLVYSLVSMFGPQVVADPELFNQFQIAAAEAN